ncbi:MAG: glycosyltransferase family 4 protein [Verrucomicrobiae bacterium]|nr:glycosyltransferase family 4 protein [Verrucomicrobiae bacterium]
MNNELHPHRMTIGFLRRGYSSTGGAEAYLKRLAEGLRQQGYRVILLGTGAWPSEEWPGGETMVLPHNNLRDLAAAALRVKKQQQIDLLFSFERVPGCDIFRAGDGVHAAWLDRQARVQPWWRRLMTKMNPKQREVLRLERKLFSPESKTKIIANSHMVAQEIRNYFSVSPARITVIPNGVPTPPFITAEQRAAFQKEFGMGEKECAVLFVGSGWKRKGLKTALLAVEKLIALDSQKPMRLWVAGKGKSHHYRSSVVKFLGPVKELSRLYAAADIFILPTLYDPFSNASLEALVAGLPVITSAANGCSEILKPDVHGSIITDPCDIEAFAAALSQWQKHLQDSHEAECLRRGCAARGAEFSIEKNVEATLRVIGSMS